MIKKWLFGIVNSILYLKLLVILFSQILLGVYQWMEGRIDVVVWNSIFTIINCYHIYRIIDERTPIKIPNEIQDIYNNIFNNFTTKEFMNFSEISIIFPQGEYNQIQARKLEGQIIVVLFQIS